MSRNLLLSKKIAVFFIVLAGLLVLAGNIWGATRYSVATGNWNSTGTWSATSGGGPGASVPVAGDVVFIEGNRNVTVNVTSACTNISIASGSTLTVSNVSFTVSGTTTVNGTIVFTSTTGTKTMGTVVIAGGTWTSNASETYGITGLTLSGSTINGTGTGVFTVGAGGLTVTTGTTNTFGASSITSNTGSNTINGTIVFASATGTKTFGNVTISGGTWTSNAAESYSMTGLTLSGSTINGTSAGTFSIGANGLTVTAATTNTSGAATVTVTGTSNINGSLGFSSATGNKTFTGSLNVAATGSLNTGNAPVILQNNFANAGTFTAGSSAITIAGAATQSIVGFTTTGTVSMTKTSGTATFTGNVNGGAFTLSGLGGTLNLGTGFTHTFSGTWTRTNGTLNCSSSTLRIGGNASGAVGTFTAGTGTVEYYASAAQNVAGVIYNNLILSGTSAKALSTALTSITGNLTLSGAASTTTTAGLTIGGNLNIGNGTTFNAAGFNLTVSGTTTVGAGTSGSLNITSATGTKIFNGLVTTNTGGTWNNSGNSPVTFRGGITNNSTFTAGSGIHTFDTNNQALTGTFSIPNVTVTGVTLTNNNSLTVSTALSGTGNVTQATNATLNIGGTAGISGLTASASGNTVNYNGGAQTVNGTSTFHHLILSGSGNKTLTTSTTSINGDFTMSGTATTTGVTGLSIAGNVLLGNGTSLNAGAFSHTIGGNWTNNGSTFTSTGSTINFNNTSVDQSINGTAGIQTFNNITVAKSSRSLIIGGSTTKATIGGTLTMTSGNINTGTGTLELGTNTTTVGTLAYTSGNIVGNYKKWYNTTATSKQIPLGTSAGSGTSTSNRYAFLTFSNLTAGSLTMGFVASNPGSTGLPLDENSQAVENQFSEGYWSFVAGDGLGSSSYTLALSGVGFSSYTMDAETRLVKRTNGGGSWALDGTHVTTVNPTASRSGLSGFGEFAFATAKPFPTVNFTTASQASISESGTLTITAQLSAISMFNVTVPFTVNGSSTATGGGVDYTISSSPITIPAGSTTGTATITIAADLSDEPNETVVVNMGTPTKALQGSTIVHTATITDDDNMPTVAFTAASQSSVNESGTMTITAQLSVVSGFNVTIPFTVNGSSTATGGNVDYHISASPLVIPAGSNSVNITITVDDDLLIEGNETVVVNMGTPTNASQGVITAHTATITDDEAPPVANFTTSTQSSVSESGTMTITIQLSAISTLNVSVPFTVNGSSTATGGTDYTITGSPVLINAGSTSGTITITITSDFRDEPNETVVVNMGSPTNASLGATVTHTATITDDDLSGFTISPTLGLVTDESGSQSSFTVRLNSQPTDNVTLSVSSDDLTEGSVSPASLTFTSANWNTNQTVTLTGVDDLIDDGDIVYHAVTAAAVSTDANYSGLNPTDVTITNSDNDIAGFTLSPTVITTTEAAGAGNTATFTVKLNTLPTANVTIGLSSNNTNEGTVSPASLTFTTANWNVNQTVTVTGVDDFVDDGNIAYSVVTASAISTDGAYNNIDPINISATNQDDDVRGITVSAISGSTSEALGTATFTVVLSSQPTADVGIGLASNNTAEGTVSPGSLTFTTANWNAPQTVTVTGVDDFVDDGDIVYSILTAAATGGDYAGINAADVTVTNIDNDTRGFTVSAISGSTTEAGGTANFTIVLNSQPTANVNLGLSSSNVAEGTISVSSLSFTTANWNTAQTVTVTGVDDFVDDGNTTYTIITAAATGGDYATLNAADVSVQNIDNDAAGFAVSPISLVVTEAAGPGQTATFTVKLNSQPTANVSIGISSSDLTEGTVAPASLTFTSGNWNTNQTLTVTGVDDPMVDGNINFSINNAAATSTDIVYNGLNPADVSVTNSDNDIAGIAVTPASGLTTSEAGGATSFTVMLTSQPSANVVIGISSSDLSEGTVSPSSITFTPGNWNVPQAIDVTGEDDFIVDGNVTYNIITAPAVSSDSNYSGMNTLDVSASNTDDDVAGFTVSLISGNLTEAGGTATFSIVLNSQPSANVIVGISSSDLSEGTVLQASHTFTGGDWNTPHVVTVTGVDDFIVDGDISFSILTAAATSSDSYYNGLNPSDVSVLNLDNDVRDITVGTLSGSTSEPGGTATFTVVLTTIPTANVSIGISSDDLTEGTVSTASLTFTPANWNTPQTVIISGVNDLVQDGDISYNIILAAATGGDYAGINASDVPVVNLDNDVADITITPSGGTTSESGTSVVFSVVLTSQPTANVSFSIVSGDTGEGTVSPSSLSFTTANWNVAKTFTVTGVADFAIDGDTPYTITVSSSSTDALYNLVDNNLPMTNTDIDIAGFIINPASGLITTEAGGTATFTVRLNTQPTANVTLGLSSNDLTEGTVSPASLTFTNGNWNTAQTVTVTGVNDILTDGDIVFSIVTAGATSTDPNYSSLNPADVSVTNTDLTPTISGFSPSPVCYGSGVSVVISGTKFTGATFVRFNGVNSSYTVNSSVQITAVLPATATTGVISVITPTGTAVSSSSLIVTPTVTINAFSPANSTRCQGAGIVTTTTTANNATGITYSLDATTAAFPGNSINAATGEVNYAVGWSGTTTITANAAGCNGPATTTHVVTVNPLTGTPVFTGGDTSICQDDPDETYSATAANSTSVTFSVLPVEAGTIGAGTGIMNWSPSFFGTATIKVTATGICGTTSSDRTVIVNPLPATGEIVGD